MRVRFGILKQVGRKYGRYDQLIPVFEKLIKEHDKFLEKDLIKKCKEWDKLYVTHVKTTYPEMSQIHATAMKPLTLLVESNL